MRQPKFKLRPKEETMQALQALSHYYQKSPESLGAEIFDQAVKHTLQFLINKAAQEGANDGGGKAKSEGVVAVVRGESSDSNVLANQEAGNDSAAGAPV